MMSDRTSYSSARKRNIKKMVPTINEANASVNSITENPSTPEIELTTRIHRNSFHDDEMLMEEVDKIRRENMIYTSDDGEIDDTTVLVTTVGMKNEESETAVSIAVQVFIPYLIAGFGTVGAGLVLDTVQVCMFYILASPD